MTALTKKEILEASDLKTEKVHVPQWGGDVYVRSMTGTMRDQFEQKLLEARANKTKINMRARLCSIVIVDDKNKPLFNKNNIEELGEKNAGALDIVFDVAQRLSGISKDDIKELEKNSETVQSGGSTSG